MDISILATILSVLLTTLIITVLFRHIQLPVILGYLLVGAFMGPHGFDVIPDLEDIKELADFGIVFLMFTVGLEFSQSRLFNLKHSVFVIGSLQVILTVSITTLVGIALKIPMLASLVIGGITAMSSTAIVVKQLQDQLELHSPHGLKAMSVLLFQDLAVIPFVILIASLSQHSQHSLAYIFLWALVKGILAITLISAAGYWLLRPLFHLIAKTKVNELFTLTVLLVALTAAWLTNILGLSYALGAFLAGIMLAETAFRHQIEVEIRPFRDILLGLFFVVTGMLVDISHWHETWGWIALLLAALTLGKTLLVIIICRMSNNNMSVSVRTGLVLAQGSEFGFAILALALAKQIIPPDYGQVILAALVISIALSSIIIRFNKQIAAFLLPQAASLNNSFIQQRISNKAKELNDHIILCGYGRVGQQIAHLLELASCKYLALDINAKLTHLANKIGDKVLYGDACHPGILKAANIVKAKALVISFNELNASLKIITMVRAELPALPILVRCKDYAELIYFKKHGATRVIAETFEESLTLAHHLFEIIGVFPSETSELIRDLRNENYDSLRNILDNSVKNSKNYSRKIEQIRPILVKNGDFAVNRKLSDFNFKAMGVKIIAIRQKDSKSAKPHGRTNLTTGDILIMHGAAYKLDEAEEKLVKGNLTTSF